MYATAIFADLKMIGQDAASFPTKTALICYWNSSSLLRSPPKDYDLSKLCAHCCTHLVYIGASIDRRTLAPVFREDDTGQYVYGYQVYAQIFLFQSAFDHG